MKKNDKFMKMEKRNKIQTNICIRGICNDTNNRELRMINNVYSLMIYQK